MPREAADSSPFTLEEISLIRGVLEQIKRDRLVGNSLRGALPRLPQRESLPTADEGRKYQVVVIPGTPDVPYFEGRNDAGTWGWRPLIGGNIGSGSTLTIASGVVTVTAGMHLIDTESAAASDDLDTISGTVANQLYVFRAADSARDVVFKDGTGNLKMAGDFTADNTEDTITFISDGTDLYELARSGNGA